MAEQQEVKNIRIIVRDEQDLYTPFSPDSEFSEGVKSYIRSKITGDVHKQQLQLTVISSSPLDEDKFRSATANWMEDERALFMQQERNSIRLQRALFIIGALIIILASLLKPYFETVTYAIVLIIGTAALGKGVTNWYEQVPAIKASKYLISEMEQTSTIVFEYKDTEQA